MFIVMIATECAPVAQAGGLGEVVFGLSRELELRGNAVEIIIPKYDCMRYDEIFGLSVAYENLEVPWYSGFVPLHGVVRVRSRQEVLLHRTALTRPVLQPGPLVRLA